MSETVINLLNDGAVSIFGGLLSAAFCGALDNRRKRWVFWLGMAALLGLQAAAYLLWDKDFHRRMYPLVVHLPLWVLLRLLTGRRLWPGICVLSAYLFCQIRRWFALLTAAMVPGVELIQPMAELAFTLPLLIALLRFAAPAVRRLMDYPAKYQCMFGMIPALYYAFDYLTRIYTDLLSTGSPVVVEFMPTVCCGAYLLFLLYNSQEERRRALLQQARDSLNRQVEQAAREISALRESQDQAAAYRHDLRHHLQYLLSCIEDGQDERAKGYISGICAELEAQKVQRYCENESVNLILSAFARRFERAGVRMDVRGALPSGLPVPEYDLCVILSNALENALNACGELPGGEGREVSVEFKYQEHSDKLFLQIANPCKGEVRFSGGMPVTDRPGHGTGVRSIRAAVERYGGGCAFLQEGDRFILRLFI